MADEAAFERIDSSRRREKRTFLESIARLLSYVVASIIFLVLMVVVGVFTYRIMNNEAIVVLEPEATNTQGQAILTFYDNLEQIRTNTNDKSPESLTVAVKLGYNEIKYPLLEGELEQRNPQILDLLRKSFSSQSAADLDFISEDRIKEDIKNKINESLKNGRIEVVVFPVFQLIDY